MLDWNVFVVDKRPGLTCYLVPLSHDIIFGAGLPSQLIVGEQADAAEAAMSGGSGGLDYDRFKPNPDFNRFLHAVLASHVGRCPGVLREARRQQHGYVYILDARTPTPRGEVPPADVIGAVAIRDGQPFAYRGSPEYEPFGRNGMMQLDPWLEERFVEEALKLVRRRS
jgi:hypothetical protein